MKRVLLGILLTSGLWVLISNFHVKAETRIAKESKTESEPFYTYDALGKQYTLIKIASDSPKSSTMQLSLSPKADVDTTFAVLYSSENAEERILPNEIIVSFDEQLSLSQQQIILQQYNLQVIHPLRFSTNRYVVKPKTELGTDILKVANRLSQTKGVKSATPNFIVQGNKYLSQNPKQIANRLQESQAEEISTGSQTNLLAQQWHLNSNPLRACLTGFADDVDKCLRESLYEKSDLSLPRTDIRATEAWQNSKVGEGVLVAVLDGLIQWNHPDLINNVYTIGDEVKDKLKGEKHGWDFVNDDEDTRISQKELAQIVPSLQDIFSLSDHRLIEKYRSYALTIEKDNPFYTKEQVAQKLRKSIRLRMTSFFHGTWVSGIIAANYQGLSGIAGVAPKAQILPVTVCKTRCRISDIVQGIDYAVARGADIINMSFSGHLPYVEIQDAISRALRKNPNLVIVAAAGNKQKSEIGFTAAIKGVISVGATNINGNRAPYSNFGKNLMIVAPGGDFSIKNIGKKGGILTTEAIIPELKAPSGRSLDNRGKYIRVEGTSFSSPIVAGVVALMKGEDPQRLLTREQIISILKQTASYDGLTLSETEKELYKVLVLSGKIPPKVSIEQYFFGNGLVNAHDAVKQVQRYLKKAGK